MQPLNELSSDLKQADQSKLDAIKLLAATITTNDQFVKVLRDAKPHLREGVYELLKPYVSCQPVRFAVMDFGADA